MYAILPRLVFLESHWDVRFPNMLHVRVPVNAILPRLVFLESHWDVRAPDPTSHWEAFCVLTSLKLMHSGHTDCPSLVLPNPGSESNRDWQ